MRLTAPVRSVRIPGGFVLPGILVMIGALFVLTATSAAAQEIQFPFDTGGRVETLSRATAERLHVLLDEYPALVEARLFRTDAGAWFLEVTTRRGSELVRDRRSLTPEEASELRRQVTDRLAAFGAPGAPIGPRTLLVGTYTALGVTFYDWAVPFILDVNDGKSAAGLGLLSLGASFYIPYATTSRRTVTYGEAEMVRTCAARGLLDGWLLWEVFRPDNDDDESTARGEAALVMGASLTGGVVGSHWARWTQMTPGTAAMVANGSDFGMLAAGGVLVLSETKDNRGIAGSLLVGGLGGVAAAYHRARARPYSWGDAEALRTAGFLGGFAATAVVDWSGTEDEKAYTAGALAGIAAGLAVGDRLVARTELTGGQAILIELGTVAGSVAGLGLAYLLASDDADGTVYLTSTAAGATAGYALTYRAMRGNRGSAQHSSLEFDLNPLGLAALRTGSAGERRDVRQAPLLSVRWRF
jgi:hypothetical protein